MLVGIPPSGATSTFDPVTLASNSQRIIGSKMGQSKISVDIPELIGSYRSGGLKLDELVTGRFGFEDINAAIELSRKGAGVRNVVLFD